MKLLVINPNTSVSITSRIEAVAKAAASKETHIDCVTAPYGVPYIATRMEALIGGRATLEILAEMEADYDAAVIAAFGDPGLGAAREMMAIPVVGLAEASVLMACPLGNTFSIVSFSSRLEPWYRESVAWCGMSNRLASIRMLDANVSDVDRVQEENEELLVEMANRAVHEDEADVIVLAGAPLAGLATAVKDRIEVPVVEGVAASVKVAEGLAAMAPRKPIAGTFRQPVPKSVTGLPDALSNLIESGR